MAKKHDKVIETIADLTPDSKNARAHNPRNLGMIESALRELGAGRSILIDGKGEIIAGNGVIQAAHPLEERAPEARIPPTLAGRATQGKELERRIAGGGVEQGVEEPDEWALGERGNGERLEHIVNVTGQAQVAVLGKVQADDLLDVLLEAAPAAKHEAAGIPVLGPLLLQGFHRETVRHDYAVLG